MIKKGKIEELVKPTLGEGEFLVSVNVSKSNVIHVFVDSMEGITIERCVSLSRLIESGLDRDAEDFELQVSSGGLGQPFKVIQQYYKNIGREVEIVSVDGVKLKGMLVEVNEKSIKINASKKVKTEGSKKKQLVTEEHNFEIENIKSAKTVISF